MITVKTPAFKHQHLAYILKHVYVALSTEDTARGIMILSIFY